MKPVSLAAMFLAACVSGSINAQPPEGRPEGERPQGQEGQPGREGRPGRPGEGRPGEGGFPGRGGFPGGPGGEGMEGGPGGRMRLPNPLLEAIDADKDGELSQDEITNAVAALKSLDKNDDGRLDATEMRPNFEGMGRGGFPGGGFPGGPGGEGGPGRDGGGQGADASAMADRLMQMDANTDGKLSKDEVPERLQSLFARADKNQDGALDKEEIMATSRERAGGGDRPGASPEGQGGPGGDFIGQMMERADADKDGKLTGDEIPEFMRERLSQADTNSDGSLDKAEREAIGAASTAKSAPVA